MSKKLSYEEFVRKANEKHSGKYDYSKTDLEHRDEKGRVLIICPIHGEFWQRPSEHLSGRGCKQCGIIKVQNSKTKTLEKFIKQANEIHHYKYDYSKVVYKKSHSQIIITCPIHGDFLQTPANHLSGYGCKECSNEKLSEQFTKPFEEFLEEANEVHNNKYEYDKSTYKNSSEPLRIICKEHGEFWKSPYQHVNQKYGCPKCNASKLECEIRNFLTTSVDFFEEQKCFEWLGHKRLDFYIPSKNIAIECQGIQHFKPIEHFGGIDGFNYHTNSDEIKRKLCEEHGVKLLYYSNLRIKYPYHVFEDKKELLKEINQE